MTDVVITLQSMGEPVWFRVKYNETADAVKKKIDRMMRSGTVSITIDNGEEASDFDIPASKVLFIQYPLSR